VTLPAAFLDGCRWEHSTSAGIPARLEIEAYGCGSAPDFDRTSPAHDDCEAKRSANVSTVAWTWRYENSDGLVINPEDAPMAESSPTQADAETWIGETWRELLDAGIDAVTLLEDGREVYGPMSLHQE
jgi:hypothetical protein